ncbi:DUF4867 family protein [Amedibacillus sp. YH-ame10]
MSLDQMKILNPTIEFFDVHSEEFFPYGKVLSMDSKELVQYVDTQYPISKEGTTYIPDIEQLHHFIVFDEIQKEIFGCMPIQCGIVQGMNDKLTGIEYHQGSEVNIAINDCVLVLGSTKDLNRNHYDVSKAKVFYLHRGDVIELFSTTLHYTPLQTTSKGFSTLVYLLEGTNTEIDSKPMDVLTKKNKWYICHPSQSSKIEQGCVAGLDGDLLILKYK